MTWWPAKIATTQALARAVGRAWGDQLVGFCSLGYGIFHPLRRSETYGPLRPLRPYVECEICKRQCDCVVMRDATVIKPLAWFFLKPEHAVGLCPQCQSPETRQKVQAGL